MSGATTYFEIPGGELEIEPLPNGRFLVGKRWGTDGDFRTVAAVDNTADLLTVVIEHTVSNTLLYAHNPEAL